MVIGKRWVGENEEEWERQGSLVGLDLGNRGENSECTCCQTLAGPWR